MLHVQGFTFNPIQENTYLVYDETGNCAIIDPGMYGTDEEKVLEAFILEKGLKPAWLLNTHCHLDHVFGNRFVAARWQLELHIHPLEQKLLEYAPTSGLMYQLPFDNYTGSLRFLEEGGTIQIGDDMLEILHIPGHSPGSLVFYNREQHFLLGGDVLFQRSIGRTDLPGGDFDTLVNGIREKLWPLPDHTIVYSGHGPSTRIGEERLHNPFVGTLAV